MATASIPRYLYRHHTHTHPHTGKQTIISLCGRDGRTICGPLCVPKSTYVTLAHKRKQKFFYFGCSLVRRFYCKIKKLHPIITGWTDRQTDRVRRNMRPPPREEGRIVIAYVTTVDGIDRETIAADGLKHNSSMHWRENQNCALRDWLTNVAHCRSITDR